ncbi:hypothetical protein [Azospirillum picis]|uniref:O-methyltransferase YrrM n=1 Tax=Azospirillum picis TaxID=488438 RepID=A0ABU0MTI3_9PROT|nr:hypothetical protein [Azospirillum picis]MBP2303084.1 putative O-methyltransferase YrrM [Azospirillum picis]MDQ0536802.1 putative O-methyltransferase YrrM [Azospirillum picis]
MSFENLLDSLRLSIGEHTFDLASALRTMNPELRQKIALHLAGHGATAGSPQLSLIFPSYPQDPQPTDRLYELALASVARARNISLNIYDGRASFEPKFFEIWPGEHYRFLAGMIAELKPRRLVEIGTGTGMGVLAMLSTMEPGATLQTLDIIPWKDLRDSWLREDDFTNGQLIQHVCDVKSPDFLDRFSEVLAQADFVFVDGPKDGVTEDILLSYIDRIKFLCSPIFFFDDTRVINMAKTWHAIRRPKLDLTAFGHWSGSGLVDWCA